MLLNERMESEELLTLRFLNARTKLTESEKQHYQNLERGLEGERRFDALLLTYFQEERLVMNDLLFELNKTYFQIDTLILSQNTIYLLDIKNFYGDWYLESDKLLTVATNREYTNPINQLKRCMILFKQLLQNLKHSYLLEASVIFVNPEFTLYQAPLNQPIILPNQVNRFLFDLNQTSSKLNEGHRKLAQQLLALNQTKNPFTELPKFDYNSLQKGIYCKQCQSFLMSIKYDYYECKNCGMKESIHSAVLRSVEEFKLLFPDQKVTTRNISNWCNGGLNRKTFYRVLNNNYIRTGLSNDTYYI